MAEESGFFTGVAGDRKYTAQFINEKLYEAMQRADGILANSDEAFMVTSDGSLTVTVGTGVAMKGGIFYRNTAPLAFSLDTPTLGMKRFDRIAIRIDRYRRTMMTTVLKGEEAGEPVAPAYVSDDDIAVEKILIDHSVGPVIVTLTDERQMRPVFITNNNSIDTLAEGQTYGRLLKAKADALNAGQAGISFRHFAYTAKAWPENDYIACTHFVASSNLWLIGSGRTNKIAKSYNSGISWEELAGLDVEYIESITNSGNTLLAAGGMPPRIYRSYNSGLTWTLLFEFVSGEIVKVIKALDSLNFLAVCDNKIYASSDAGVSWTLRGTITGDSQIVSLESLGGGVLLANGYATGILWRSTDNGATWTMVKNPNAVESKAQIMKHLGDGIVLVGLDLNGMLLRSTDYGLTWDTGTILENNESYCGIIIDGEKVYIGAGKSIYMSADKGMTWSLSTSLASSTNIESLVKDKNNIFCTLDETACIFWGYPIEA